MKTHKICPKCGILKPATREFFYKRGRGDELRPDCKVCRLALDRTPEGKARYKKYHRSPKGLEALNRAAKKPSYQNYRKQWLADNAERFKELHRMTERRRMSRKRKLPATLTEIDWKRALAFFNNSCAYCGKQYKLEQEHFIPITKNGGYTADNIVPACKPCNVRKYNSLPEIWCPPDVYEHIQNYFQSLIANN